MPGAFAVKDPPDFDLKVLALAQVHPPYATNEAISTGWEAAPLEEPKIPST